MEKIPRSFGTHSGSFHADEVTACALLLMHDLIDRDKIFRTRDSEKLGACEFVCDVGGVYDPERKLFDHHQVEYRGQMSSAGMILKYLKDERYINEVDYEYLNRSMIHGVDLHDNGKEPQVYGYCSISHVVANFNPIEHGSSHQEQDRCFFKALDFIYSHLKRMVRRIEYIQSCREVVEEKIKQEDKCLIFDKSVPWLELFFDLGGEKHPAVFIVMPSGDHWKLRGVPPSYEDRMNVRVPLPKEWAGLHNEDLKEATGIDGAIFCHKGRFISVWETKEDALKALDLVMEKIKE
jgi:uncharacterized UPF0160 family protein